MSYDLYIYPHGPFAEADFARHFSGRPNYQMGDGSSDAWYRNDETGTYFSFSFSPPATEAEIAEQLRDEPDLANDADWRARKACASVAFNMNYIRPHVFAVEAEPEVAAFLEAFDSAIEDYQSDGMANGPYSREGFLRGWNVGNSFGYRVILAHADNPVTLEALPEVAAAQNLLVADSERIADVWSWNFARKGIQDALEAAGHDVFVPKIMWGREKAGGSPIAFVVWSAGVPTVFPGAATHVLVGLERRPKGLLQWLGLKRQNPDESVAYILVPRQRIATGLPLETVSAGGRKLAFCPSGRNAFDQATFASLAAAKSASDPNALLTMAAPDAVLDAGIFEDLLR